MRYKVVIKYDGTNYYGFQKQKDKITIQSELEKVLSKIFNESINITGCSRTDKKVHANYFVFHFDRSEEHTSELQSRFDLVCRLLLEKKKKKRNKVREYHEK